jgi:hypothetical protein
MRQATRRDDLDVALTAKLADGGFGGLRLDGELPDLRFGSNRRRRDADDRRRREQGSTHSGKIHFSSPILLWRIFIRANF